jgi:hypothetical protein
MKLATGSIELAVVAAGCIELAVVAVGCMAAMPVVVDFVGLDLHIHLAVHLTEKKLVLWILFDSD